MDNNRGFKLYAPKKKKKNDSLKIGLNGYVPEKDVKRFSEAIQILEEIPFSVNVKNLNITFPLVSKADVQENGKVFIEVQIIDETE